MAKKNLLNNLGKILLVPMLAGTINCATLRPTNSREAFDKFNLGCVSDYKHWPCKEDNEWANIGIYQKTYSSSNSAKVTEMYHDISESPFRYSFNYLPCGQSSSSEANPWSYAFVTLDDPSKDGLNGNEIVTTYLPSI